MREIRHKWLQDTLHDKQITQRALAEAWGINEAMVSRFIRTGAPEMTMDRFEILRVMLMWTPEELLARLREKPAPRRKALEADGEDLTETQASAMDALQAALEAVRKELAPIGYVVKCRIEREI